MRGLLARPHQRAFNSHLIEIGILDNTEQGVRLNVSAFHGLKAILGITCLFVDTNSHQRTVDIDTSFLQFSDSFLVCSVESEMGNLHQIVILMIEGRIALLS